LSDLPKPVREVIERWLKDEISFNEALNQLREMEEWRRYKETHPIDPEIKKMLNRIFRLIIDFLTPEEWLREDEK